MEKKDKDIKEIVKSGYGKIAKKGTGCCTSSNISRAVGYSDNEMKAVPDGANLGLGCGNPVALASLKEGEVVLDLGSGAGFDAFLAAQRVGKTGRVIGVDMTPEMLEKANLNARKGDYANVEFRLGEIEKLPVEDNAVDAIISNCVINLSPDKESVFKEAFRVLKPGGRLMVSDLALEKELPGHIRKSVEAYVGCLSGAILKEDYLGFIEKAGFKDIKVVGQIHYPVDAMANDATAQVMKNNPIIKMEDLKNIEASVLSIKVHALKPGGRD